MAIRTALFAAFLTTTIVATAAAQPVADEESRYGSMPGDAPPSQYIQPGPTEAAPPPPPVLPSRWAFGFQLQSGGLEDAVNTSNNADILGYGIFGRYRFNGRWELELGLGKSQARLGGDRVRQLRPLSVSALYHLFMLRSFDIYLRAGIGTADETYVPTNASPVPFENHHAHVGGGLEYLLRQNIGIAVEGQAFMLSRTSASSPLDGSGTKLGISVAYHF